MKAVSGVLAAVLVSAVVAACGSTHPSTVPRFTSSAARSAEAQAQDYLSLCIPKSGTAQVALARTLLTQSGRQSFAKCLAIPAATRPAFEGAVVAAAEKVRWTDKAQRTQFFEATVPALAFRYRDPSQVVK